jgi:hypothetical protein
MPFADFLKHDVHIRGCLSSDFFIRRQCRLSMPIDRRKIESSSVHFFAKAVGVLPG